MRFVDTNSAGRILNRFLKEMGETDEYLSRTIKDTSQYNLIRLRVITVTVVVNPKLDYSKLD